MEANLQNHPLNEEQVQQLIINEDQEEVQQQQQQQQQQLIINEVQEQEFDNDAEQSDDDVSQRVYVLDEIDPHPLRCNLCPSSTFTKPKGIKAHRKAKHGLYKFECHCGFLYFTDQDRERHISDRHPKAPKQKKCPKKRKKAR